MNDEDIVNKSAALAANNDHTNKLLLSTNGESDFASATLGQEFTEVLEISLITKGNANDGLNEELWPPFC